MMNRPADSQAERLLLDAKKAILQEQHRKFQNLQDEGRWDDAWKQLHITLICAADLLKDSVALLEQAVEQKKSSFDNLSSSDNPSE